MEVPDNTDNQWSPPPGWEVVNITLENMTQYLPRMGYLFSDGLFDLAKVNQSMVHTSVKVALLLGGHGRAENHPERKCWIISAKGRRSQEEV